MTGRQYPLLRNECCNQAISPTENFDPVFGEMAIFHPIDLNESAPSGIFVYAMHNAFGLFIALFAAFWFFSATRWMARELKTSQRAKWIKGTMYLLILIGAGGFFAAALSATGIINLPASYEWPAGYVRGVVRTIDGKHIVPLMPSGRVQIYDSQWHFIRGWNVDASGGDFRVRCSSDKGIEVFTARGQRHYSFSQDGQLISSGSFSEPFSLLAVASQSVVVPTPLLLWIFSSPLLSWAVAAVGFVGLTVMKKMGRRASDRAD